MNNEVGSQSKSCVEALPKCESIANGVECEQIVKDVEALKLKAKQCNGIINGTSDPNKSPSAKTDTSLATLNDETRPADEHTTKKTKSKRKAKSEVNTDTKCDFNHGLYNDFDITNIIRNKYKQEGSQDKIKIIVNQIERLELKHEKFTLVASELRLDTPIIDYVAYQSELQMPLIMKIIQKDLSEPYSIYTYRYFIHNWPNLCFLAMHEDQCVGAIVCKLDMHRKVIKRGYIAMLAVDKQYRKHGIGSTLVKRAIQEMIAGEADEVVLETEITNRPALRLYEALGFVRDKRLFRYYLNGVDALRLKLWLR